MTTLKTEFVEFIPDQLADETIYVSIPYRTVIHKCLCGCAAEIVTPLAPTDWRLTFDGETVSLHPSIGNWSYPCKSHYWIRNSKVVWDETWLDEKIQAGREYDKRRKAEYYSEMQAAAPANRIADGSPDVDRIKETLVTRFKNWIKRKWQRNQS